MSTVWQLAKSKQTLILLILCLSIAFTSCSSQPTSDLNCPEISQSLDNLEEKNYGKILFDKDSSTDVLFNKLDNPYLYRLGDNKKEAIINGYNFSVSNDRSMLAYQLIDENILIVSDNNGKTIATLSTQYEDIESWVDDGLILDDYNRDESILLKLFSGERVSLQDDFPNRYVLQLSWRSGAYEKVYYDPSLSKAFYFAKDEQVNSYYFSLWDVLANAEITRLTQSGVTDSFSAQWALDGKQVIVYASFEDVKQNALFSVHTDGKIETLLVGKVSMFALSPDSQSLAFWSYDDMQEIWNLSVLDIDSKDIIDYCISSKYFPETSPLWSPDSQSLVVYLASDNIENTEAVFIDRRRNFLIQIAENAKPVGWLK